eukprot:Sspe_Gene.5390::Locus_1779_Transcript_2_3_Confidence_0.500_Length_1767::g.5390::m.5390/K19603/MAPK15; mitogen-activated protein kinase 15
MAGDLNCAPPPSLPTSSEDTAEELPQPLADLGIAPGSSNRHERYEWTRTLLGGGGTGRVYLAVRKHDKVEVAVKKFFISRGCTLPIAAKREIETLRSLGDHPGIAQFHDCFYYKSNVYMVFPRLHVDLARVVETTGGLSEGEAKWCLKSLVDVLAFLEANRIVHRDIKPSNLMLALREDGTPVLKLTDFGMAAPADAPLCNGGTNPYKAPESMMGLKTPLRDNPSHVDVWAAGCVFSELLLATQLFLGVTDMERLSVISQITKQTIPSAIPGIDPDVLRGLAGLGKSGCVGLAAVMHSTGLSDLGLEFLGDMLIIDPVKRPTPAALLHHPYLACGTDPPSTAPIALSPSTGTHNHAKRKLSSPPPSTFVDCLSDRSLLSSARILAASERCVITAPRGLNSGGSPFNNRSFSPIADFADLSPCRKLFSSPSDDHNTSLSSAEKRGASEASPLDPRAPASRSSKKPLRDTSNLTLDGRVSRCLAHSYGTPGRQDGAPVEHHDSAKRRRMDSS